MRGFQDPNITLYHQFLQEEPSISKFVIELDEPVGDRDHEVLGMGSFVEYKL
jgi:hypothetical protein